MKNKQILVTGGTGLLGRSVIQILKQKGYRVTAIDLFKRDIKGVEVIQGDFANRDLVHELLKDTDAVIHLAAMLGVDNCRLHPDQVIKVNYENTKTFIDECLEHKVKRFVFTSSSEIYGNSKEIPYREESTPSPLSVYGKSKVLVEEYLKTVQKKSKMTVGITRLFNVYGFNQRMTFVVPLMLDAAFRNKPLSIFGDGEQVRCFTYVDDAANAIVKLIEYDKTPFEIINIGRKKEYTITQLAKLVLKYIPDSRSKIQYLPYGSKNVREENLEIRRRVPLVEKAKRLLHFEAKTSLEAGLKKIIKEWQPYYEKGWMRA